MHCGFVARLSSSGEAWVPCECTKGAVHRDKGVDATAILHLARRFRVCFFPHLASHEQKWGPPGWTVVGGPGHALRALPEPSEVVRVATEWQREELLFDEGRGAELGPWST